MGGKKRGLLGKRGLEEKAKFLKHLFSKFWGDGIPLGRKEGGRPRTDCENWGKRGKEGQGRNYYFLANAVAVHLMGKTKRVRGEKACGKVMKLNSKQLRIQPLHKKKSCLKGGIG